MRHLRTYYTSFPWFKLRCVDQSAYGSKAAVVDASLLAANVPWFVSLWPFRLAKGVWGFDAGILTYFRLPRRLCCAHSVLSVAPFLEFERKSKGERDPTICPRVRIPMHWGGFPPNSRVLVL